MNTLAELSVAEIMQRAYQRGILIPAFNIAYLPMVEPTARTVQALDSFALIEVARPDIENFGAESYAAVRQAYARHCDPAHLRLHQDHVPVIDENGSRVDWEALIAEALRLEYDSVMVDGSRLPLAENTAVARSVVAAAHPGVAVEAELGAVLGHEAGPLPPYEELYRSGRGFTDVEEAARFVRETGVDWLSVAIGNVHGAISGAAKDQTKVQARLNIPHLKKIAERTRLPLVLHGGTGIELACLLEAVAAGITKINVGTGIRQPFEASQRAGRGVAEAQAAVARAVEQHLTDYGLAGSAAKLAAEA
jgi:fructose/tagatose bisphosphate aldolase